MPLTPESIRQATTELIRHAVWRIKKCAERLVKRTKLTTEMLREKNHAVVGRYFRAYCEVLDCDAEQVEEMTYAEAIRFHKEPTDYFADRVVRQLCERYCP
jgi:hypothetical protein